MFSPITTVPETLRIKVQVVHRFIEPSKQVEVKAQLGLLLNQSQRRVGLATMTVELTVVFIVRSIVQDRILQSTIMWA
jgi:hypothetical protein